MLKRLEALFLGGRWRRDEHAWRVWQGIGPSIPARLPDAPRFGWGDPEILRMTGRVVRIYQRARRGSKALVDFGAEIGMQDTWWEHMRPPVGSWVVVHAHLWLLPGTHSGEHVLWVDHWESWAPGDTWIRAQRHQHKLEKEQARGGGEGSDVVAPSASE